MSGNPSGTSTEQDENGVGREDAATRHVAGGTTTPSRARRRVANPDDPPVAFPRRDSSQSYQDASEEGSPGRTAIVQGQVYIVGVIMIAQLVLITIVLYELLSGVTTGLWSIAATSLVGFAIALLVAIWPNRRVKGF